MTELVNYVLEWFRKVEEEYPDPRTKDFLLCRSPWPIVAVLFFYYHFSYSWGPALMKNRKPFQIDKIIQIYNLIQIAICAWVAKEIFVVSYGPSGTYDWACEPVDTSNSPSALRIIRACKVYYILKFIDLLDTVFFIMRKKFSQVTHLHVTHHFGMIALGYIGCKYIPGGHGMFLLLINSVVHCFMYAYYFLANYDPEYRKKIWWKKYLTQLQIFLWLCFHFTRPLWQPNCDYPRWALFMFLPNDYYMLYMFCSFYKNAYLTPKVKNNAQVGGQIDNRNETHAKTS